MRIQLKRILFVVIKTLINSQHSLLNLTSYALNSRYNSLGFVSMGRPLTNKVLTWNWWIDSDLQLVTTDFWGLFHSYLCKHIAIFMTTIFASRFELCCISSYQNPAAPVLHHDSCKKNIWTVWIILSRQCCWNLFKSNWFVWLISSWNSGLWWHRELHQTSTSDKSSCSPSVTSTF